MKKTYEIIENNNGRENCLDVEIYYDLGGMNYFTYKVEPRGYYFSITPLERVNHYEVYSAFSGVKKCVLEVKRKSKKAEAKANAMMAELENKYLDSFCKEHGYKIRASSDD